MTLPDETIHEVKQERVLNDPLLVAVWPGMGAVSISAGYYLMAKLGMHLLMEFPALELFDLEHVEVKRGLILADQLPRSRLFLWHDPRRTRDLIVFIGEAQPPSNRNAYCSKLISHVQELGVKRVFTFAAMATQMRPGHESRVFGAAIDRETLAEFTRLNVRPMEEGNIGGLNGAFLGIAAEAGMAGGCLLGEMPGAFPNIPFPKASLSVLEIFSTMADITLDFEELRVQSRQFEKVLENALHDFKDKMEQSIASPDTGPETAFPEAEPELEQESERKTPRLSPEDSRRIEELFTAAGEDRSRAYELKRELDRLNVFRQYEDRFLDLFENPE